MRTLRYLLALIVLFGLPVCAENNNVKNDEAKNKLTVGMNLSQAKLILAENRIKEVKHYLSVEYGNCSDLLYYMIEENVSLVVCTDDKENIIKSLSIMFSPSYRPVNGLDTYKALDYIKFDSESYVIKIKK